METSRSSQLYTGYDAVVEGRESGDGGCPSHAKVPRMVAGSMIIPYALMLEVPVCVHKHGDGTKVSMTEVLGDMCRLRSVPVRFKETVEDGPVGPLTLELKLASVRLKSPCPGKLSTSSDHPPSE